MYKDACQIQKHILTVTAIGSVSIDLNLVTCNQSLHSFATVIAFV